MTKPRLADLASEAEDRYRGVADRYSAIGEVWQEAGSPLLTEGSQGQLVEHPLLRLLRLHELELTRLAIPLRTHHAGPEPSAVLRPSIGLSPSTKLRRLK